MPQSKPRSYVGLLAAMIGGALFLFVYPDVEQEAHLRAVRSGDATETLEGLRRLCFIRDGAEALDELIPSLPLERRADVLDAVVSLGCLEKLEPDVRATYYLLRTDEVDRVVGYADEAVAPSLEVLAASDPVLVRRAARALALLGPRLSTDEREEVVSRIATLPEGEEIDLLRRTYVEVVAPELGPVVPDQPDMGAERASDVGLADAERLVPALQLPELHAPTLGVLFHADDPDGATPDVGPPDAGQPVVEQPKPAAAKPKKNPEPTPKLKPATPSADMGAPHVTDQHD